MKKNQLIRCQGTIYRVLAVEEDSILLIDCIKKIMPKWYDIGWIEAYENCSEEELLKGTKMKLAEEQDLGQKARCTIHERFTVIAGILPFIDDERLRAEAVKKIAKKKGISEQTVRNYLCQYLAYQSISALLPKERTVPDRELTEDEKNFRWALNKFYFTRHKNSLKTNIVVGMVICCLSILHLINFAIFIASTRLSRIRSYQGMGLRNTKGIFDHCLGMSSHLPQMSGRA